jgi:membrane-associated PAP2 superfamily phosphatase
LLFLAVVLGVFEPTSLDIRFQDLCYDFEAQSWLISKQHWSRPIFYDGVKIVIILFGVLLILILLIPRHVLDRFGSTRRWEKPRILTVTLCVATIPAAISFGKAVSDVYCPRQTIRYGGDKPYLKVFEKWPEEVPRTDRGRAFPAGHASGGFALISLCVLFKRRRYQICGVLTGLVVGGAMGLFQTLNGNHYLSHSFVTIGVAWFLVIFWVNTVTVFHPPRFRGD